MIKTPVTRHDVFTSSFVDKFGCFLDDKSLNEAAKRINMHEELVDALKICLACYENEARSEGGIRNVEKFKQLLEKCK